MEYEVGEYVRLKLGISESDCLIIGKHYMFSFGGYQYDLKPLNLKMFNDFGVFYGVNLEKVKHLIVEDTRDLYLLKGE